MKFSSSVGKTKCSKTKKQVIICGGFSSTSVKGNALLIDRRE